jgi:hypothetical protein
MRGAATTPRRIGALAVDPQRLEARYAGTRIQLARLEYLRAAGIDAADLAAVAGHTVETATARYALGRSDERNRHRVRVDLARDQLPELRQLHRELLVRRDVRHRDAADSLGS